MTDISIPISKITIQRLVSDIKAILREPLDSHKIYYKHDEVDLLKGYAMIIGPDETPYAYGYHLFEFNFPKDYPFSPPVLTYWTKDGRIRFNPNLYINGKVCLSILNTWKGEQWTSCQTISSVLMALVTVLNNAPLENEPGITKFHKDLHIYNKIIRYKNMEIAMYRMLTEESLPDKFNIFQDIMKKEFTKNYSKIIEDIKNLTDEDGVLSTGIYSMTVNIDYSSLLKSIEEFKNKLI